MVGPIKLPDPSLNHISNALSIGVQYTVSFQLTNFGLKYLLATGLEPGTFERKSLTTKLHAIIFVRPFSFLS